MIKILLILLKVDEEYEMSSPEGEDLPDVQHTLEEAESAVSNLDLDAIEEHHGQALSVWINYIKHLKSMPGAKPMTIDESNVIFTECISKFQTHVISYTTHTLSVTDSESEAISVLTGVGSLLDKERVDTINELCAVLGMASLTSYANKDRVMGVFNTLLDGAGSDEDRVAAFSKLVTYGLPDDIEVIDTMITRINKEVEAEEELSQRQMITEIYNALDFDPKTSKWEHVVDVAKVALGVTIGVILARKFR